MSTGRCATLVAFPQPKLSTTGKSRARRAQHGLYRRRRQLQVEKACVNTFLNGFAHLEAGANRAGLPHRAVKQTTYLVLRRKPGRSHRDPLISSVLGTQSRNLSLDLL
jgi:hypothetical protein